MSSFVNHFEPYEIKMVVKKQKEKEKTSIIKSTQNKVSRDIKKSCGISVRSLFACIIANLVLLVSVDRHIVHEDL